MVEIEYINCNEKDEALTLLGKLKRKFDESGIKQNDLGLSSNTIVEFCELLTVESMYGRCIIAAIIDNKNTNKNKILISLNVRMRSRFFGIELPINPTIIIY